MLRKNDVGNYFTRHFGGPGVGRTEAFSCPDQTKIITIATLLVIPLLIGHAPPRSTPPQLHFQKLRIISSNTGHEVFNIEERFS